MFSYVEQLSQGHLKRNYTISEFASKHTPIGDKLKELKDVIIRCYPEKNNYLLNAALLEIILCEQDLTSHCMIEDKLFVPAVKLIEQQLRKKGDTVYVGKPDNDDLDKKDKLAMLSDREKDIIACVTKGMSNKDIIGTVFMKEADFGKDKRNCMMIF